MSDATESTPTPTPDPLSPLSFTVVGDSLTAGQAPGSTPLDPSGGSWVPAALGAPLSYVPGFALAGATTAQMLAGVTPEVADVVVVLAGTNDLLQRIGWRTTRTDLEDVVSRVGVGQVLLVAVPPSDRNAGVPLFNLRLAALAQSEGWAFLDPWTAVDDAGAWRPGTTEDGIHPVLAVAQDVGRTIREQLLRTPR